MSGETVRKLVAEVRQRCVERQGKLGRIWSPFDEFEKDLSDAVRVGLRHAAERAKARVMEPSRNPDGNWAFELDDLAAELRALAGEDK